MADTFTVELVFALANTQSLLTVSVASGATVQDVLANSGIGNAYPEVDVNGLQVGIWGRVVAKDARVKPGDRVEIYRPLEIEPRDARRQLAEVGRTMGRHNND